MIIHYFFHKGVDNLPVIAKYTSKASGTLPTFNEGYTYTTSETVSDGVYTVELTSDSDFTSVSFTSSVDLLSVEYLKITNKVTSMSRTFYDCTSLQSLDASNWDTSSVTNMQSTFHSCTSLQSLDVSDWDTSSVTTMFATF